MKMNQLAVLTALILTATAARAEHIKYSQLPQQVQKAVVAHGGASAVKDIEQSTENGRTIYKVQLQREGRDRHLKLSADGKLLDDNYRNNALRTPSGNAKVDVDVNNSGVSASTDVGVDTDREAPRNGIFSKSDGKILGIFPAPSANDNKAEVRTEVDTDDGLEVKADADLDTDNDVFKKGDGKILGVDVDHDDDGVKVEGDVDIDDNDNDIFKKGDGKILGVDVDRDDDGVKVEGDVDIDDNDNDIFKKGDGKILGVDVDRDDDGVKVEGDVDIDDDDNAIFKKGDGKILGVDVDRDDDGVKVEGDVDLDTDKDNDIVVNENDPTSRNKITTDADGGLDTDKNDGRILGLPKRGFSNLDISQVPEPVRKTIRQHARGAKIAEIELADHNGMQVYEVDVERDGQNQELHIAADGRLMKDTDSALGNPAPGESGTRIEVKDDEIKIKKD